MTHFWEDFARHGDATALVSESGESLSYSALFVGAEEFANRLYGISGGRRGVLLLEMRNSAEAIVAYLGALRARWPIILAPAGTVGSDSEILRRFQPDAVFHFDGEQGLLTPCAPTFTERALHPELAVMLSTSGSTGSPKLVKLSRGNIDSNARSIAEYLQIAPDRVAITNLPGHYSYGLSIINSFLASGARLALTESSVVEDSLWDFAARAGVTDLAGVPYTYELLERLDFRNNPPASLKVMTQAGGRLPVELVESYAAFARDRGIAFFVMYGQTEATARMAYLPPDLALANSGCIGRAIPGGRFFLRDDDGGEISAANTVGELCYAGPNVMMGYAETPADLATGPELDFLATGDIALRNDRGLYRVVGRSSRFSKIAGLRIGHDDVEAILRDNGTPGHVTGDDQTVVMALSSGDPAKARAHVSETVGLPASSLYAWAPDEIPRLTTGKVDYQTLRRTGLALAAETAASQASASPHDVQALYARTLNLLHPNPERSFLDLGGDSLAFVAISIGLEEMLGDLPDEWQTMPLKTLQALADKAIPGDAPARSTINIDVPLRLFAITLIFLGHAAPDQTEMLRGGSGILFLLAGYSMAIAQLPLLVKGRIGHVLKGAAIRLVLPYYLAITGPVVALHLARPESWYLFYSTFAVPPNGRKILYTYWFFEVLIVSILFVSLLFLIPPFRRAMAARPFQTMIGLFVLAVAFCHVGAANWQTGYTVNLSLDAWFYIFVLGWLVGLAKSPLQMWATVLISAAAAISSFGSGVSRPYWLILGLIILLFVRQIPVGRKLRSKAIYVASATYFMYLLHPMVLDLFHFRVAKGAGPVTEILLIYPASIIAGIIGMELWNRVTMTVQKLIRGKSALLAPRREDAPA